MPWDHNDLVSSWVFSLMDRPERSVFRGRINSGRLRCSPRDSYVPDVFVVPNALSGPLWGRPDRLEVYDDPMPFVAEVWEPPTDEYDASRKLDGYRGRGDREI